MQVAESGDLELVVDVLKARTKVEKEREKDERTARLYGEVANTIMPKSIVMEVDFPSAHANKRIPILDMEVWMTDQSRISFNFYSKPMASQDVINARSAFTTREKKNVLLEEASRRLRNCAPMCTWTDKAVHLTKLNLQMRRCGHQQEFRSMITCRAVAKYHNSLHNHLQKKKVMYRSRKEMVRQWEEEGGKPTKSDWFSKSGATGVFNLPATKDSWLANTVQQVLDTVPGPKGSKILVTERPGRSFRASLCTANPFPRTTCGRQLCPDTYRGEDCRDTCYRESVGYAARCRRCHASQLAQGVPEEQVQDQVYLGESSRSLPTRQETHVRDYGQDIKKKSKKSEDDKEMRRRGSEDEEDEEGTPASVSSWMADHARDKHGGVISADPLKDYEFSKTGTFMKPLHRQVDENLRISRAERDKSVRVGKKVWRISLPLLNRKHEYWAPRSMTFNFSNYNR